MEIYYYIAKRLLVIAFIALLLIGCLGKEHLKPRSGGFNCQVLDSQTGEAVPGATVTLGSYQLTTNLQGEGNISNLPPGDYQVTCERPWYQKYQGSLHYIGQNDPLVVKLTGASLTGKIYYSSNYSGKRRIYCLDLATRQSRLVISNPEFNDVSQSNPAFWENGSIIFQSDKNSATQNDLFGYNVTSGVYSVVYSTAANDEHPSSDGSGQKIVFQSGGMNPYLWDNAVKSLTPMKEKGQTPVIDRAGSRIAGVSTLSKEILIYNLNGTVIARYEFPGYKIKNPCWNPEGTKIAFEAYSGSESSEGSHYIYCLYLVGEGTGTDYIAAGTILRITYSYNSPDQHTHPCWSGDGKLIFFSGDILYESRKDIYCIDPEQCKDPNKQAPWLMVSGGSGSKEYPIWGE